MKRNLGMASSSENTPGAEVDHVIDFGVKSQAIAAPDVEGRLMVLPEPKLSALPEEPLLKILQYVNWRDLLSLQHCCRRFTNLANDDSLWGRHCRRLWLLKEKRDDQTWKQAFASYYRHWAKYVDCYSVVRNAWNRIQKFLIYRCPQIYESLQEGVPDSLLDDAESGMGLRLPLDLRCSFRICNGQRLVMPGVMGSMSISTHYRSECLVDLETASSALTVRDSNLRNCLPLTLCIHTATGQFLCLKDGDPNGHRVGEIFYPANDNPYEDLDEAAVNARHVTGHFVTASSFSQWLTEYADNLESDSFPVIMKQIFLFKTATEKDSGPPPPLSDAPAASAISVSVKTCFLPELSSISPAHFFHTYRVTIRMDPAAPASFASRLISRHWAIADADGLEEVVDGAGVVGEYPVLKPGVEHSYVSCVTFSTSYGNMSGHFTFQNLNSSEEYRVPVPMFHMRSLPYLTEADLKEHKAEVKKNE